MIRSTASNFISRQRPNEPRRLAVEEARKGRLRPLEARRAKAFPAPFASRKPPSHPPQRAPSSRTPNQGADAMTDRPIITLPTRPSGPIGPPPRPAERIVAPPPPRPTLTAQRLKITVALNADELLAVPPPDGKPRVRLRIRLPDRKLTADIAAKSLRKAQAAIREAGADTVALIAEAGLTAQLKAAKQARAQDENVSAG